MNIWTDDPTEVRYHMLRPAEARSRRESFPVAYVPLGTLEWHGPHNPLGSDTLQAEGIAVIAARLAGGLVLPPLYYGEPRVGDQIVETLPEYQNRQIAEAMGLNASNFDDDRFPAARAEQDAHYHALLLHILYEAQSLGFKVCIFAAGHYPLINPANKAAETFNARPNAMKAWAFVDYQLLRGRYTYAGDHAAYWETSHMAALYPHRVDLSLLPERGQPLVGISVTEGHLPQDADPAFGYRIMLEAAQMIADKARELIQSPAPSCVADD
jgi:creatinine amidohydrolase